jgi:hypothetical protein
MSRDACDVCGSDTFGEGRFSMGKLWCLECFSSQRPPVANPPTPAYREQIKRWLAPRRETPATKGKSQPAQLALAGVELAQPQGASRG